MFTDFKDMPVWEKGKKLVVLTYAACATLPKHEQFALAAQIRSAAISIPANIAEGFGRLHTKDKINFYIYSRGSAHELRSHLACGIAVNYFQDHSIDPLLQVCLDVERELNFLIRSLR